MPWPTSPISCEVYLALSARLDEQKRTEWVREEMEVLTSIEHSTALSPRKPGSA